MKVIAITRVSTEEQKDANNSLPAQIARVERYCAVKGLPVPKMYSFDESAYSGKRRLFAEIVAEIEAEKDKVALCVDKIDRLTRDVFDPNVRKLDDLRKDGKLEMHFISDNVVLHKDSPATDLFRFTMGTSLAKYFSDSISDNTKRGLEGKLMRGELPGKAPVGYKNAKKEDGTSDVVVDPYWSKIVVQVYTWYYSGAYSMNQVRDKLKTEHKVKWSKGYLDQVLKNEFYVGVMVRNTKRYKHRYQTILDREMWDKVQEMKSGRNRCHVKLKGLKDTQYRGLIHCADCGRSVTNEKHKGHTYYHCTEYDGKHGAKFIREEDITKQLAEVVTKFKFPEDKLEEILTILKTNHEAKSNFYDAQYKKLTADHMMYENRLKQIYLDKIDGRITESQYNEMFNEFRGEQQIVDNLLGKLKQADDTYYLTINYLGDLAKRADELFASSIPEEKHRLLALTLSNLKLNGRKIEYIVRKPFDQVVACNVSQSWGG